MSDREMYLGALAGEYDGQLPPPSTRSLKWMAKLLGQEVETEPVQSPEEAYLKKIAESGGGGGVTPSGSVSITANDTYDVTEYAEAAVNVPNTYTASDAGKVVRLQGGSGYRLVAQTTRIKTGVGGMDTTYNNYVTFQLAALENAAAAADIASGKTAYGADGAVITGTGSGGGITPAGTLSIARNGAYDVTEYAEVDVDVPSGGGAQVYTISGTGADEADLPGGVSSFMTSVNGVPAVSSAVGITLMGTSMTAGCVGYDDGVASFAFFYKGGTIAYAEFTRSSSGIALTSLTYQGQDMKNVIPQTTWTITVFDNSGE